ncbi:retrovirus-related Pol polyprotein from transposon 412 [Trichonephila clavipes]|uniref:Retrovirus-related Pol polyprotein from transposon 412 n=1 Tax=Trichonephila clavipes TaxID=2585209 RepID=A0A8X6V4E3_TRICX|nr:retrovirus-related Pol polyprotein from transposon 412 [Trichonephila clavipes]
MPRRDGPYIVLSQRSPTTFVVASCDKPDEPLGVYHTSALTPFLNGTETQSPVVPLKKRGRPRKQPLFPRGTAGENAIMSASTPPRRDGLRRFQRLDFSLSTPDDTLSPQGLNTIKQHQTWSISMGDGIGTVRASHERLELPTWNSDSFKRDPTHMHGTKCFRYRSDCVGHPHYAYYPIHTNCVAN